MVKEYLGLSVREKKSFLIVLILLMVSILIRIWISIKEPEEIKLTFEQKSQIEAFISSLENSRELQAEKKLPLKSAEKIEFDYSEFNPNVVSRDELLKLGVREFVADNILRYRDAGGEFRLPEDLLRIYGMDPAVYKTLEPWIFIPEVKEPAESNPEPANQQINLVINLDLNSALIDDLMGIEGMEPKTAGRIISYRELLGGFYSPGQLKEVYGLPDSVRVSLESQFDIDTTNLRKISLKKATFSELLKHPYFDKPQVKEIFRLKDFYGDSLQLKDIFENKILPDSILKRIIPYLED